MGLAEAVPMTDAAEGAEQRGERGRRRRRRGGRDRDESRDTVAANDASVADLDAVEAAEPQSVTPDAAAALDETPAGDVLAAESAARMRAARGAAAAGAIAIVARSGRRTASRQRPK